MLVQFTVGNYRSFDQPQTFSMVATNLVARDAVVDANNVFAASDDLDLVKTAAIYGANASGKSNLIDAFAFMRRFVLESSTGYQAEQQIEVQPFKLKVGQERKPSFFEAIFFVGRHRYRYGFQADKKRVVSEWLYHVPSKRERKLFHRELQSFDLAKTFREGNSLSERTRQNALFLSVVAQFNGTVAQRVLSWFGRAGTSGALGNPSVRRYSTDYFQDPIYRDAIVDFVKAMDLGIAGMEMDDATSGGIDDVTIGREKPSPRRNQLPKIRTQHTKFDEKGAAVASELFNLDSEESHGTRKLFLLAGPLLDMLLNGRTLFVDELDARLHPLITSTIIKLFNSERTNAKNAQLIFTTHDTNLLDRKLLRRDQIWFVEKDSQAATHLYSLAEYKVRNDASFEKDYVSGRYGAIPFLGDFQSIVGPDE
jgi:AAA15 family ATPase/GTPase